MKKILIGVILLFAGINMLSAQTVGLIKHDPGTLDDGYVLFAPTPSTITYLIDKCGKQIKTWNSNYTPGHSVYLLPDGTLFRTGYIPNNSFFAGGQGGQIEKIDWNDNLIWSYTISDSTKCQHHDSKVLPNGNVLVMAWELKSKTDAIENGRPPAQAPAVVWSEQILEIQPVGTNGGIIVWEWHLWDHLAQEYDSTKLNYCTVADNPQLLNINFGAGLNQIDWIHMNSIDYNPVLDQILLGAHNANEIWIIDHSTTSAEAAGHTGGNSGKGGDILYRWGNPKVYNNGTFSDRKFYGQHNAQWIEAGFPYENQIIVFNNGFGRPGSNYSTVEIINPPVDGYTYTPTLPYLPSSLSWIYNAGNSNGLFSKNISGAQQLINGNVLICDGPAGNFFEVNSTGSTLWKYINPVNVSGVMSQGTVPFQNVAFRCTFYPDYYSAFTGQNLVPGTTIEDSNPVSEICTLTVGLNESTANKSFQSYPNPASGYLTISGLSGMTTIYNSLGIEMWSGELLTTETIDVSSFPNGVYFIRNNKTISRFVVLN